MRIATGDAVILLDGDLQDPPELIVEFYEKWLQGFEVVYGRREKRNARQFLQLSYKAFYRLFRATSYVPIPLDAGDFIGKWMSMLGDVPEQVGQKRGYSCKSAAVHCHDDAKSDLKREPLAGRSESWTQAK